MAGTLAEQKLKVTQTQLEAAKDKASAIVAKAQADADVIRYNNKAELAGLASRVAPSRGTARPWRRTSSWASSPRASGRS